MKGVFQHKFAVVAEAVDGNGHVNTVEYLRWTQTAAVQHANYAGCTQATQQAEATWVVRSHYIEYLRPAFAGNQVAILTWVADFRKASSRRCYKIMRVDDHDVLAKAETEWVFVDASTGRPRSIPPEIKALFTLVPQDAEPDCE